RKSPKKNSEVDNSRKPPYEEIRYELDRKRGLMQIIPHNAVDSSQGVPGADFFAFLICSPVVGNPGFVNAKTHVSNFCDYFRFEAKPVLLDSDLLKYVSPEDFVAGFHVS